MRILIYVHDFLPSVGGVENVVAALASGLAGKAQVRVVTQQAAGGFDDGLLPYEVVRQPAVAHLWRMLREADLIHLAGPSLLPMALGWLLRKKVVVEHHGFQAVCPNGQLFYEPTQTPCPGHFMAGRHGKCLRCNAGAGWLRSVRMWLLTFARRWFAARSRLQIAPTQWLSGVVQLNGIQTIYHGVRERPADGVAPGTTEPKRVVYLGRLVSTKGVSTLLAAVAWLRQRGRKLRLEVIGDGRERLRLEASAKELGITEQVGFRGRLPEQEVEAICAGALCVVMPSLGGEVFGLVAAEQMMRGRVLVVTKGEALAEVVGEAGLVFPAGDAAALGRCLERLLDQSELAKELGVRGRARALDFFREQHMIDAHLAAYRKVMGDGGRPC